MRLNTRLILAHCGLILLTLSMSSATLYHLERRSSLREQRAQQQRTLEKLAAACREAELQDNLLGAINFTKLLLKDGAVVSAACVGADGRIRAHSEASSVGLFMEKPPLRPGSRLREDERGRRLLELWEVLAGPGLPLGSASLAYDQGRLDSLLDERLFSLVRRIATVCLAVFPLAVLASMTLASRLTRPIQRLVVSTRQLSAGGVGGGVEERAGIQEVDYLIQEFNSMAGKLAELDRMKEEFMASVTHDLKTPLAAVLLGANMLAKNREGRLSERDVEDCWVIVKSVQKLSAFIDDILDFSRMEAAQWEFPASPVSLREAVMEVVELQQPSAQRYGIELACELPPDLPEVMAHRGQLERVITNLVGNAFKFTPHDGKVTVRAAVKDGEVLASVQDTGMGIPPESLSAVFDKFYQVASTKHAARKAGTGLGLPICKKIVEGYGGRIWVESQMKKGTTFHFTLPAAPFRAPVASSSGEKSARQGS